MSFNTLENLKTNPIAFDGEERSFDDFLKTIENNNAEKLLSLLSSNKDLSSFLKAVCHYSPHLRDLVTSKPDRLYDILTTDISSLMASLSEELKDNLKPELSEGDAMQLLRNYKQKASLGVALGDLACVINLETVTDCLTEMAEITLQSAINWLLSNEAAKGRFLPKNPENPSEDSGYIVLGMGKLGGRELNFSSDIDLIVFFEKKPERLKEDIEAQPFFVRLTQRLVKLMQERTQHGYVFRTDLRLRPDPGATAIAMSLEAALTYYESLGQNWERSALIKARPVAGDTLSGDIFLKEIKPFIWRKYLDYAAIADIHAIKRQIHLNKGHGSIAVKGHNVKLGRGGIREIEFFVQTQQLIAGGRDKTLRGKKTLGVLEQMVATGWVEEAARLKLTEAYTFLRNTEHRIQMLHDEQTHTLPETEEGLLAIAKLSGFQTVEAFSEKLTEHLENVQKYYSDFFEKLPMPQDEGNYQFSENKADEETLLRLDACGFKEPASAENIMRSWFFGRYAATRSAKSRERLTQLLPALAVAFGETDNPDQALIVFDRFLSGLPAGMQLFSILTANPGLLALLAQILGTAPRLAETVGKRPHIMDSVLDPAFFGTIPDQALIENHLQDFLSEASSYEDVLDRARIAGQEQAFLLGVRVLTGTLNAYEAGKAFSNLADSVITALLKSSIDAFSEKHGFVSDGMVCTLAMGKLGGREMTAASDLDLMLIYDFDKDAEASDGERPLSPQHYFSRLTQRLVTALSTPTAEGLLYEVDFRLRPSGNAGPLATSIDAFERYQMGDAWVWEHMALTRARPVGGDEKLRNHVSRIIHKILTQKRDREKIMNEVADMRLRIEKEKGTTDPWYIKHVAGGMVDIEFIAQALQLVHAHEAPEILNTNTEKALQQCAKKGFLKADDADLLLEAIRLYSNVTQVQRLCVDGVFRLDKAQKGLRDILTRAGNLPDISVLEAHLKHTEGRVRQCFSRLVGVVETISA
jgi:glutamate-ammonia-ligase adenylyltransferase